MSNRLTLDVCVLEKQALRTSLTGVAVVEMVLAHQSMQTEAGHSRQTQFEIEAIAMGELAPVAQRCELGGYYKITGFLNRKSLKSVKLRFHITHIGSM